MEHRKKYLSNVETIVIKIGSAQLTNNGKINQAKIKKICSQIAKLKKKSKNIIIVTSGAIASAGSLSNKFSNPTLIEKQALASIGQVQLMETYRQIFSKNKITIGQILIAESTLTDRSSYLNVRNTINQLLTINAIPIINENDSVSTKEIKFGDNDTLGAIIAGLISADLYIILSDIDGFYFNYGKKNQKLIDIIHKIDNDIEKEAFDSENSISTGGMKTKIKAAKTAYSFGIPTLIANGSKEKVLNNIFYKKEGTLFLPSEKMLSNRKKWIISHVTVHGRLFIDEGAIKALQNNKSLLPKGIIKIKGKFNMGAVCEIYNLKNQAIGKGMVNYNSIDLKKIICNKSSEIESIIGYKSNDEAIHKDNLVLFP